MHRIEQLWVENRYTLEGTQSHRRVHGDPTKDELAATGRIVRSMWLKCDRLRIVGKADVVEFREQAVSDQRSAKRPGSDSVGGAIKTA